jgi:hypothetical protein
MDGKREVDLRSDICSPIQSKPHPNPGHFRNDRSFVRGIILITRSTGDHSRSLVCHISTRVQFLHDSKSKLKPARGSFLTRTAAKWLFRVCWRKMRKRAIIVLRGEFMRRDDWKAEKRKSWRSSVPRCLSITFMPYWCFPLMRKPFNCLSRMWSNNLKAITCFDLPKGWDSPRIVDPHQWLNYGTVHHPKKISRQCL